MRFRSKPVEIEAYQLTRAMIEARVFDNECFPDELWLDGARFNQENRTISYANFSVTTIHGQRTKCVEGDWIITEPGGKGFYPCKPEVFASKYEPIPQ